MFILYILTAIFAILVAFILFLIICSLLVNPSREYAHHSSFYRGLLNFCTACSIKLLRIKLHVSGVEKIPKDVHPLFVSNHLSNFDPILSWYVFRKWKPAYISKAENFKVPVFGRLIRKCCFLSIDRENPKNAILTIRKAVYLLQNGEVSVGIYPEGTRSRTGQLLPFHSGVFKIAEQAAAPIVIFSVKGTESIHQNYPLKSSHVYLDVLEVIPAAEVSRAKSAELSERARTILTGTVKTKE